MSVKLKQLAERGDTIVEVLISIAVVSLILGGAYVTTNRSLQASRAAQERTNASKIVEGQIEAIKDLSNSNPTQVYDNASQFCVNLATSTTVATNNAACKVDSNASPTSDTFAYNITVNRQGTDTFTVAVKWDSIVNKGQQDNVTMTYRIPQ